MTETNKPCLPNCYTSTTRYGARRTGHAEGCPNAKPAEPPYPKREVPRSTCLPDCAHTPNDWGHSEQPVPAEPEGDARHYTTILEAVAAEPQVSEPPMRFTCPICSANGIGFFSVDRLVAGRDTLKAENTEQRARVKHLEDLIVRYCSTSFVGGTLLEEARAIRARREEAKRG